MPRFWSEMGPNFYVLGAVALLLAVIVGRALIAVRWGREVRVWPLVAALALPLLGSVYASTWQFTSWDAWVETRFTGLAYETMKAMVLSKAVHTQIAAGLISATGALATLLGVVAFTVKGDRPRAGIGLAGIALTAALLVAALVSGAAVGALGEGLRVALYVIGGVAATTALVSAHGRGPGVQAGTLTAIAFPFLVAGIDQAAVGYYAFQQLSAVAAAAAPDKAPMLHDTLLNLDLLRGFSPLHLGLAIGLATLGPLAAWRNEPELATRHAVAMLAGCTVCGLAVGYAASWAMAL